MDKKAVAVDLDGVLAEYDGFKGIDVIGDPIPGAREFMKKLKEAGAWLIIHTCRVSEIIEGDEKFANNLAIKKRVEIVWRWLCKHDIPCDEIWAKRGKPYAVAYVDDRAVVLNRRYRPRFEEGYEFAWKECLELLEGKENE